MSNLIRLRPLDVMLFRDARPYSPDDNQRARAAGLVPWPGTIYGMLRNLLLETAETSYESFAANGEDPVAGSPHKFGSLEVRGPFLTCGEDGNHVTYLSAPADLMQGRRHPEFLRPQEAAQGADPPPLRLPAGHAGALAESSLLEARESALIEYLTGSARFRISRMEEFARLETAVRHKGDFQRRIVEDGFLFTTEFQRFSPDVAGQGEPHFTVETSCHPKVWPAQRVVTIGGERRPFLFQLSAATAVLWKDVADGVRKEMLRSFDAQGRLLFRLVLITPACFPLGWRPPELTGFSLIGAAVPRFVMMGGWNRAAGAQGSRAVLRMCPAGTVYFYRSETAVGDRDFAVEKLFESHWYQPFPGQRLAWDETDPAAVAQRLGLGLTLIGTTSYA